MKNFDAVIIGFGKAGKTLAVFLASKGQKVAMVEKDEGMYGGTCINVGCIPSKSLVYSSHDRQLANPDLDRDSRLALFKKAVEEKTQLIGMLRNKNYHMLADKENITVFHGTGSFENANTVKVSYPDGSYELLQGEKIVINTGARPLIPAIEGLSESKRVYVSETLLNLDVLPEHFVVLGGGYIGLEFASIMRKFGSKVTIIQRGATFLPKEDRDIADAILADFEAQGIRVVKKAKILSVNPGEAADEVVMGMEDGSIETLSADALLLGTGRKPNVEGLNLEAAGVKLNDKGAIAVDEHCRTGVPNVWAVGDVTGHAQFTYMSLDDFRIVRDQLFGQGLRTMSNRGHVPYSVFIDPAFSRVGMTEEEAKAAGYTVKVGKLPAGAIPKARILRNPRGLLKVIINEDTNEILGAHLFCEESYEMINLVKVAMDAHLSYTVLRDAIYTHPTMTESFNDLFKL